MNKGTSTLQEILDRCANRNTSITKVKTVNKNDNIIIIFSDGSQAEVEEPTASILALDHDHLWNKPTSPLIPVSPEEGKKILMSVSQSQGERERHHERKLTREESYA